MCTLAAAVALVALLVPGPARALKDFAAAEWAEDYSGLSTDFGGIAASYEEVMSQGRFPQPGEPIVIAISSVWPVVFVHARFATDTTNWPADYRSSALDLALMYACDASHYQETFGRYLLKATFDRPPEFVKEAEDPHNYKLVEALRGKPIKYQSTASAGIGAADYTVVSVSTIGLSEDGRTVIVYSDPESISEHLRDRKLVIGIFHHTDSVLYFDIRGICLCRERWLFRDEMLHRIGATMTYIGHQMHKEFCDAPSLEAIEDYLADVRRTGAGTQ
jgi:hypothetical protein